MSNMQEMFDMEIPEWLEESEEARGSKKAVVAVIMFFVLFLVGNVIPTILQMISLVSFIVKEIDLSSLNLCRISFAAVFLSSAFGFFK